MPLHKKINAKEVDPNPNISFISVLKEEQDSDEALQIIKSIAAQFRPICEKHHLYVNSLEEAAWNPQFAGRNWNAGEVIELVLRNRHGQFLPVAFICFVMAHELAHIMHMNHLAGFQKFNNELRQELRALQARNYYGDGFYSAGRVIRNGLVADGLNDRQMQDLPEQLCGATGNKKRKGGYKRSTHRRQRLFKVVRPGSAGGEQKSSRKGPKAGSRVRSAAAFAGCSDGQSLSSHPDDSTFRKQANSKSAKEKRALAAEERMRAAARAVEQEADSQSDDDDDDDDLTKSQQRKLEEMNDMADDLEEDLNAVDNSATEDEEVDELESSGEEIEEPEEKEVLDDEKAHFISMMSEFRQSSFANKPPEASSSKTKVDAAPHKGSPDKSKAGSTSRSVSPAKKASTSASTSKPLSPVKRQKREAEEDAAEARKRRRAAENDQIRAYFNQPEASGSGTKKDDKGKGKEKATSAGDKRAIGSKAQPIELD